MIKSILCVFLSMTLWAASSQKIYFVYIQSEASQPFYVKMNDQVRSSTGSGYIVLSRLHDSTYTISIGFTRDKEPEIKFSLSINQKDHGYLLKNFGEKGWGLFDLQTLSVQMPAMQPGTEKTGGNGGKAVSPFTSILSKAADDPSLKEKPVMPVEEVKKTSEVLVKEDTKKVESKPAVIEPKPALVESKPVVKESKPVVKESKPIVKESKPDVAKTTTVVPDNKKGETVVLKQDPPRPDVIKKETAKPDLAKPDLAKQEIVKPDNKELVTEKKEEVKAIAAVYQPSKVLRKSESSTSDGFGLVFIDQYANGTNDTIRLLIPNPSWIMTVSEEIPKEVQRAGKNGCNQYASEGDFFKLRKDMAAVPADDEMVALAKKDFKLKCYTTKQVRNLAALFLTDEGKYKFLNAAYAEVLDPENFGSLQSELKDDVYINRFKVMLKTNP